MFAHLLIRDPNWLGIHIQTRKNISLGRMTTSHSDIPKAMTTLPLIAHLSQHLWCQPIILTQVIGLYSEYKRVILTFSAHEIKISFSKLFGYLPISYNFNYSRRHFWEWLWWDYKYFAIAMTALFIYSSLQIRSSFSNNTNIHRHSWSDASRQCMPTSATRHPARRVFFSTEIGRHIWFAGNSPYYHRCTDKYFLLENNEAMNIIGLIKHLLPNLRSWVIREVRPLSSRSWLYSSQVWAYHCDLL